MKCKMLSNLLFKFSTYRFKLSDQSIAKLVETFPQIRHDVIDLISDCMDRELSYSNRHPGMSKEHLKSTGLCAILSGQILRILEKYYPVQLKQGYYKLDHHPRFPNQKIYSLHSWLEIDNKIVDFTAQQFEPFVNHSIPELLITNKSDPHYMTYNSDYQDVALDDEHILNWYIEHL